MTRLFVSEQADRDIETIFDAVNRSQGPAALAAFDQDLSNLYRQITDFPRSGSSRPALGPNIRIAVVASYIMIYRYDISYQAVNVLRIVHGRRNLVPDLLAP